MSLGPTPQTVTSDLRGLIQTLEAGNQGQAHVRAQNLLAVLKELTTQRRHPTTRKNSYPAELAGFDVSETVGLRKAMAHIAAEIEAGNLDLAVHDCRRELALWSPSEAD